MAGDELKEEESILMTPGEGIRELPGLGWIAPLRCGLWWVTPMWLTLTG